MPSDTDYDTLTQELRRSLLSLPKDNNNSEEEGGGEGTGPILRVSHHSSCFAPGSNTVLTLVNRPLLLLPGRGSNNGEGG